MKPASKGRVFVSHSTRGVPDYRELVDNTVAALEARGYSVFLDRKDLAAGEDLPGRLGREIRRAQAGIVVVTRESLRSQWVGLEVAEMLERQHAGHMRVYALRLEAGCPPPAGIRARQIIEPVSRTDSRLLAGQIGNRLRRVLLRR